MIRVDQGGEYRGETYIWCDVCSGGLYPVRDDETGIFEGSSLQDLEAFLAEHRHQGVAVPEV